jgi:DNA-binding transcriptional LysR family regulator
LRWVGGLLSASSVKLPRQVNWFQENSLIVRNFEYLLALERERHFGRAAASCRVSQPTLSAGIKQLEEDMDVLIVRRGQRFDGFTPEGARVLAWAQQMNEDCQRLKQELSDLREKGVQGPFRLGMLPATSALAPILSVALAEQMPSLELSIFTSDAHRLLQDVRQTRLDVALVYIEDLVEENLDIYALYRERMFLFTTQNMKQKRVGWEDVVALPLCLLRFAAPPTAEAQLKAAMKTIATDSLDVLAAHLATGRWSTVLPQSLAVRLGRTPGLRAIPVTGPGSHANVGFVTARRESLPPAVRGLLEMVHTPELVKPIRALLAVHRGLLPDPTKSSSDENPAPQDL